MFNNKIKHRIKDIKTLNNIARLDTWQIEV